MSNATPVLAQGVINTTSNLVSLHNATISFDLQAPITVASGRISLRSKITPSTIVLWSSATADVSTTNAVFDGIIEGDKLTVSATGTFEDANAGEGKIVNISNLTLGGDSAANYEIAASGNQEKAKANITKKAVTVIPDEGISKVYGEDDPTFTYEAEGLLKGETLKGTLSREPGQIIGEYPYNIGTLDSANSNYHVSLVENAGTFTITKAALTVKADAKTITYGDEAAALTYKVEGLVGGDTEDSVLAGELTREEGTDAGVYKITQGSLSSDYYSIIFVGADYVIEKASQSAPTEEFTTSKASDTTDGEISGFDTEKAYQYSADGGKTWTDVTGKTVPDVKVGTYQIRYAGDRNHEAGAIISVTVEEKTSQDKPDVTSFTVKNAANDTAKDGKSAVSRRQWSIQQMAADNLAKGDQGNCAVI